VVVVFLIGLCAVVIRLLQSHSNAMRHLAHQNQQLQTVLNDLRKTQAQHSTSLQKIDRLSAQIATTAQPSANLPHPASTTVQVDQRSTYDPLDEPRLNLEPKDTGNTISLSTEDLIKTLNFPQHANDTTGFGLLRRALKDQNSAQLVIAAQDILTLMSQDAIYMDDLPPERAPADLWRQFAQGARGGEMDALGGIRDQDIMEKVSLRMKTDPIFRDAAHHFLRLFDRNLSKIAQSASDADISALANTRTARAFMILGRAMGTFQ
jgi:hypothetical protein